MSRKDEARVEEHEQNTATDRECPASSDRARDEGRAASGGEASEDEIAGDSSLEEQLAAAREEARRNYEKYLRAVADWENYRRRMTREKDELRQYAVGSFIEELLPVLDNLELGLQTAANHPEAAAVMEGFRMVADQINRLMGERGLATVNPVGEPFDPHQHESVACQPDPEKPEGVVTNVVRPGYFLNGRLLRPASVVVSSGPPPDGATDRESESTGSSDGEPGSDNK